MYSFPTGSFRKEIIILKWYFCIYPNVIMTDFNRKQHWETIYQTKAFEEVSWYQPTPKTSLALIETLQLPKDAPIIDIGGGDSFLVDYLLDLGYNQITVLDISEAALQRAQQRLGERAHAVQWICADVTQFEPPQEYAVWHDRAAFHFLTEDREVQRYIKTAGLAIASGGHLLLATFSDEGPKKCSGIDIRQYNAARLEQLFATQFEPEETFTEDHPTPSGNTQNFVFCRMKRKL